MNNRILIGFVSGLIVGLYGYGCYRLGATNLNGTYSIEQGFKDETGEFHAYSCERTKANGDAYSTGVQRFNLTTAPSIEALSKHQTEHYHIDETASVEWHKPLLMIDYNNNHEVCVKSLWRGELVCFDLYELGER